MKSQYVKPQRSGAYARARHAGKEFLSAIESFAEQGYTDASIAYALGDKFDYLSYEFLSTVEDMARQGLDDLNIAIGLKEKFGIGLSSVWFSTLKNQKDKDGKPTKRANLINEALARGRAQERCKQFDMEK